jgi:hypothetical protein
MDAPGPETPSAAESAPMLALDGLADHIRDFQVIP